MLGIYNNLFLLFTYKILVISAENATSANVVEKQFDFNGIGPVVKIVGGTEAPAHVYSWQVSMQTTMFNVGHFCGGALLRVNPKANIAETDIVLTSGHCCTDPFLKYGPKEATIVAGAHDQTARNQGEQISKFTFKIIDRYNEEKQIHDLCVVKLTTPIKFGQTVQPIELPAPGATLADGTVCILAGWGSTDPDEDKKKIPAKLQHIAEPIINNEKCVEKYKDTVGDQLNMNELLCAGYIGENKGSGVADSGGSLICNKDNKWVTYGVLSFSTTGLPDVYTRVSNNAYLTWIQQQIAALSDVAKK